MPFIALGGVHDDGTRGHRVPDHGDASSCSRGGPWVPPSDGGVALRLRRRLHDGRKPPRRLALRSARPRMGLGPRLDHRDRGDRLSRDDQRPSQSCALGPDLRPVRGRRRLRTIANELNADGAAATPPRRHARPRGWAPSSVRELLVDRVLYRPVLRGMGDGVSSPRRARSVAFCTAWWTQKLVAPTGFEPVFQSRPGFRQQDRGFFGRRLRRNPMRLKHAR